MKFTVKFMNHRLRAGSGDFDENKENTVKAGEA